MSELALPGGTPLPDKILYAKALAEAGLLPSQYREKPANVLFAMEYAEALGLPTITAITSVHVIDGKPSASADLIAFLVRRAGHKLRIKGDDTSAEAVLIRADDPEFPFEVKWDKAKAEKAGLWGKGNWAKYPAAMLKARCITEVARMGANDALFGIVYTPEELGAEVDADGIPVITTAPAPRQAQPRPLHVVADRPTEPAPTAETEEQKAEREAADADWLERVDGCDNADDARALYREAKDAGQLQRRITRDGVTRQLFEWINARGAELAKAAAEQTGPAAQPAEPEPVGEEPGETPAATDPLAAAQATVAAAGLLDTETPAETVAEAPAETVAPVEGEVLDAPRPAPVEDPEDMCRNTAQRKAVQNELMAIFGGQDPAIAAIEQEFGVPHTKVSTKRLREFMTREQQANKAV